MDAALPTSRLIKRRITIHAAFHQTDMMGVIHNSAYLLWFEEGRLQIMLEVLPMDEALSLGIAMPVVENRASYRKPVKFGMPLLLFTTHLIEPVYTGRLVFEHSLIHEKHKTLMAFGQTVTTLVDMKTHRLVREWPQSIWKRYQSLV